MKIRTYLRMQFGNSFRNEIDEAALTQFCIDRNIDTSVVEKAKQVEFDYNYCPSELINNLQSFDDWKQLNTCYIAIAYQDICQNKLPLISIGMGIIKSPSRNSIPNIMNVRSRLFDCEMDARVFSATKRFDNEKYSLVVKQHSSIESITDSALFILYEIVNKR